MLRRRRSSLWGRREGRTTSQITNSWNLEIPVETLDTAFLPRSSHTREVVAQIGGWLGPGSGRCRVGLGNIFEVRHDCTSRYVVYSFLSVKNEIQDEEWSEAMRNRREKMGRGDRKKGSAREAQQWGQCRASLPIRDRLPKSYQADSGRRIGGRGRSRVLPVMISREPEGRDGPSHWVAFMIIYQEGVSRKAEETAEKLPCQR